MSYWNLIDLVSEKISIYDGESVFLNQWANLPEVPRNLFAAEYSQVEICNGGFSQFFSNSTGVLAPEAVTAFHAMNLPGLADIVSRANSFFGNHYPRDRQVRQAALVDFRHEKGKEAWNPFEDLENEFYELFRSENGGYEVAANNYSRSYRD